jgi:ATP-dependent helicase HrpB
VAGDKLPIQDVLADVSAALSVGNRLVLAAPPGAGKTTLVPLSLAGLYELPACVSGKILLLEPRRVAARMAAQRMAHSVGGRLGDKVGLSTRIDRKVSAQTQIEVITDGLFARRILADPELSGVGAVIFDEFHERRLNNDMGLALALDAQTALRNDLKIVIMSATLDTATVAKAIDAPVIESHGRQFPVETRYLGRSTDRIDDQMERGIRKALQQSDGSILAFLPGAADIRRVAERLERVPPDVVVAPLFGALAPGEQDAAVSPAPAGTRKIVLATDIAESSLTIEGVTVVVDSGLARIAEEDVGGLGSRLTTVKASRASVDQRRGRAGRTAPGICYRLWDEAATRGLAPAPMPEILKSDLAGMVLALAEWGEADAGNLTWIDAPPKGRLAAARVQLEALGALDVEGRLTALGRDMSRYPLAPQLAALVARAEAGPSRALAAQIAALAGERGMGGNSTDLRERLSRFRTDGSGRAKALMRQAKTWGEGAAPSSDIETLLAQAWPHQIARRRAGDATIFLMASGRAGRLPETDPLAKSDWLVIVDMGGGAKEARISLALPISEEVAFAHGGVEQADIATFDVAEKRVTARRVKRMGAIILSEAPLPKPSNKVAAAAIQAVVEADGFEAIGAQSVVQETVNRLELLASVNALENPPNTDDWRTNVDAWLMPVLLKSAPHLPSETAVREALIQHLEWPMQEALRKDAPLSYKLETGQTVRVDYLSPRAPLIMARAQVFYGSAQHPSLAGGRVPLTVELLSPAQRAVAATQDLQAFWQGGYVDMAKDMRSQYPKHDWPEDPANAAPHEGLTKRRLNADR